ncbi:MAG TPA: ATP-dependent DNA helicase RecG, partial [Terriglobales bacterium]|nr:ATP-dependent DNA helicase RecG [Terriglobales bacterium]
MSPSGQHSSNPASLGQETDSALRARLLSLQTPLRYLKGIGPRRAEQLERIDLKTVEDFLYHLPFRYEDRRQIKAIANATPGEDESFMGQLARVEKKYIPRRRAQMLVATLRDSSGTMALVWYRAPAYLIDRLIPGQALLIHGKVESGLGGERRIVHPEFEVLTAADEPGPQRILPVYVRPGGLPLSLMRRWMAQALDDYAVNLVSSLPQATMKRLGLMPLVDALDTLHRPDQDVQVAALNRFDSQAHRSIILDEFFYLQLGLSLRKQRRAKTPGVLVARPRNEREILPFELTRAQKRVLNEIYADLESRRVMHRLIQGDVGSGKTIVAWLSSLRVIENGYQAVWMAPTEILSEQHFLNIKPYADRLGIASALVTGSQSAGERRLTLERIARGEVSFIVGTHAVIQEQVRIPRMGLGVIDEQHRFGVVQRLAVQALTGSPSGVSQLDGQPHMLLMSATPIPRTLAMILYGDLDVSFIDEMPPGRMPVRTKVFTEPERSFVYRLVLEELRCGHQVFVVYPLVEPSEQLQQVRDATQMAERMRRGAFRDFGVGLVHGKMPGRERDEVMRAFRAGSMGVLVATTVIEVGIDVPNATVMVIEHAERFGLSQLHQLRGRVGRGSAQGHCLLINRAPQNPLAQQRLRAMEREQNGLKIADADLALRGPGELLGTRQSGLGDFRLANFARDTRLLMEARREAQ